MQIPLLVKPLKKNAYFIVVGDLNVDIRATSDSANILKSLIQNHNIWIKNPPSTYEDPNFKPNPTNLLTVSGRTLTLLSKSFSFGKNICTFVNCYLMLGRI